MSKDMSQYVKKAGAESEYTPETIQELIKCKKDPIHFFKNYVYIQHPKRGKVKFDLFPYQEKMVQQIHSNRFNILKVGRQQGKCVSGDTKIEIAKAPTSIIKKILYSLLT